MPIAQLPALDAINLDLRSLVLKDVVRELFEPLRGIEVVSDPDQAWKDLMLRTSQGFLALDRDIALPHARTGGVKRLVFAAGRHFEGFSLSDDAPEMKLVFLVLTPKEKPTDYLHMLAALSSRLRVPEVHAGLLSAKTDEEFVSLLDGDIR